MYTDIILCIYNLDFENLQDQIFPVLIEMKESNTYSPYLYSYLLVYGVIISQLMRYALTCFPH